MLLPVLTLLLACADPSPRASAPRPSPARPGAPTPSALALDDFAYIGPGSMGRFVDHARHPRLSEVIVAGADVGGVYLSVDDGASWTNVTRDLPANGVWSLGLVVEGEGEDEITRVVLGTDSGLFHSADLASGDGLEADEIAGWTEAGGLDFGDERADQATLRSLWQFNRSWRSLTVGAVAVSPSDPSMVWAGVTASAQLNLAQNPKNPYSLQRFDRWKLYRSTDGGRSWEPALRFEAQNPRFVAPGYDAEGSVFGILVDPEDPGRVWVASDRGLYASENADTTEDADGDGLADLVWTERGTTPRRETRDLGQSWEETAPGCEHWSAESAEGAWCLPVVETARVEFVLDPETGWPAPGFESHPNTRSLSRATVGGVERLYLTVWDRGHADDQHEDCSPAVVGDDFKDEALAFTRGGVYASDDGGERWRWLLTDSGAPGSASGTTALMTEARYRCDDQTSERSTDATITFFPDAEARPEGEEDLLVVSVAGGKSGLWRYDPTDADEPWDWLTDQNSDGYDERFEGSRPYNISTGRKITLERLVADWEDAVEGWPRLSFGMRGLMRATWDADLGAYTFDHLGSDYAGELDGLPAWQGTGLDDAVVWDVQEAGDQLYVAVSDGAVLVAELQDGVWTYTAPAVERWTSNWSTDPDDYRTDETNALAHDETNDVVYASNVATASDYLYSVLALSGGVWTVVGGYGWPTEEAEAETIDEAHMNGLYTGSPYARMDIYDLAWVPPEAGSAWELLLAGTDGLWAYDQDAAADAQWARLCDGGTRYESFAEIALDVEIAPGHAFAVSSSAPLDGLLAVDLRDGSCEALVATDVLDAATGALERDRDPIVSPSAVALATDADGAARLVVGAGEYATLYSGELDCAVGCAVGRWTRGLTVEGLYAEEDPRAPILARFEISAIAVDPRDPRLLLASLGTKPGYDYYNPEWMLASEDGGQTVSLIGFAEDDHELPNRSLHQLEFSSDGGTLYAGSRSSLFAMPVGW